MAKPISFTGQLNPNSVYASLFNQVLRQKVFSSPISAGFTKYADKFRVEGSMLGDAITFTSTDIYETRDFLNWADEDETIAKNASNVLETYKAPDPKTQVVYMDTFKQVGITTDQYRSKQAWMKATSFSDFTSALIANLRSTKQAHDGSLMNTFIGVTESDVGKQQKEIVVTAGTGEEAMRTRASQIATEIANLFVDMGDISREYNDNGFIRTYDPSELMVIWNSEKVNEITKMSLPTFFHNAGLIDKFAENVLAAHYFGKINEEGGTADGQTVYALTEGIYGDEHLFAGQLLPEGTEYVANTTYTEDANILCKIIHKDSVPYMSGFVAETSFFNAKSLATTNWLTFGYSQPTYLQEYPWVTVRVKESA